MNDELVNFIRHKKKLGHPEEAIRENLAQAGWKPEDIQKGMEAARQPEAPVQVLGAPGAPMPITAEQEQFLKGWSIGSLVLSPIYFFASRRRLFGFLALIPTVSFVLRIIGFFAGRKMAWHSGKWSAWEPFERRQRTLDRVGLAILLIMVGIFVAVGAFATLFPQTFDSLWIRMHAENVMTDLANGTGDSIWAESTDAFKKTYGTEEAMLDTLKGQMDASTVKFFQFDSYDRVAMACGGFEDENYDLQPVNLIFSRDDSEILHLDAIDFKDTSCRVTYQLAQNISNAQEGGEAGEAFKSLIPETLGDKLPLSSKKAVEEMPLVDEEGDTASVALEEGYDILYGERLGDYSAELFIGKGTDEEKAENEKKVESYMLFLKGLGSDTVTVTKEDTADATVYTAHSLSKSEDVTMGEVIVVLKKTGIIADLTIVNGTKASGDYMTAAAVESARTALTATLISAPAEPGS